MAVPVESVTPGKCFVTKGNQVRRVLALDEGVVDYEARGPKMRKSKWPLRYTVDVERFAADFAEGALWNSTQRLHGLALNIVVLSPLKAVLGGHQSARRLSPLRSLHGVNLS